MCGIIGINASNGDVIASIVTGLKNLEYRGYDSAGMACIIEKQIRTAKVKGKISNLEEYLNKENLHSNIGIGHTRWATHGAANQINAHPHQTEEVSVVHNGIIENYMSIKQELIEAGHKFLSQTDSEVIPHLITYYLKQGNNSLEATKKAIKRLEGAFSIAVIFASEPDIMIAARKGSPLVVGYGDKQMVIASDAYALSFLTNKISYLLEGDLVVMQPEKIVIYDAKDKVVTRNVVTIDARVSNLGKGNFSHYMLKEIFEQPSIMADLINRYYDIENNTLLFDEILDWRALSKITLVACGSSHYSAMVSKYWLEQYIDVAIEVDIASEFRYRNSYLPQNGLCIFLSQSGETADTLAAMRYAKTKGQKTLSIVNVAESSLDRESDYSLQCYAGPEISVASTKGFTTQLTVLLLLTLYIAQKREYLDIDKYLRIITEIPGRIAEALNDIEPIKEAANIIAKAKNVIFIGRKTIYPVALEGALKLKELSYIHAEAIAAGELKHGPIALIDENVPIIVLAPQNSLFEKTCSNAQEIAARGGKLIVFSSLEGNLILKDLSEFQINISFVDELIEPIIYALPMQLLAYYVAIKKGTDVDQPRNLAKSVTVE
jgi:glucosamine--fructose-6-phosphate aminotransferase (isomerizing)